MKLLKYLLLTSLLFIIGFALYTYLTPPASPLGEALYTYNNKSFKVKYSRPYKKDRLIFGNKEDGALVPYNEYWRTGANFSTDLTVSDSFYFGEKLINEGSYWLYTIPGKDSWQVFLNSDAGSFSFFEPEKGNDVVKIDVKPFTIDNQLEQFTINFIEVDNKLSLRLLWDKTGISIPIN
ncbi:MAG: hypothetical protein CL870_03500 [Cytophagia bacterium]|nr:hypothetical protein [Cytophagia bacterium]|tara:strand:- start:941 stop:1477 length:537 start_codon:yes stop_codon:yes gene_type:complete